MNKSLLQELVDANFDFTNYKIYSLGPMYKTYCMDKIYMSDNYENCVVWDNIPCVSVSPKQYNDIIDSLEKQGYTKIGSRHGSICIMGIQKRYYLEHYNRVTYLYWIEYDSKLFCNGFNAFKIMVGFLKSESEIKPKFAYNLVRRFFNDNGLDFARSIGTLKGNDKYLIKHCIPSPINYALESERPYNHCYKVDVSSAYSYEGTKAMPDAKKMKRVAGIVEPNKDYPFAFYPSIGHMAIYNELDTRTFPLEYMSDNSICSRNSGVVKGKGDEIIKPVKETLLMPRLSVKVNDVLKKFFEHYYDMKVKAKIEGDEEGKSEAKAVMNYLIGYWQKNDNPLFAHLSAVIIARCCNRMIKTAEKLMDKGCVVLLIATDSISWTGKPMNDISDSVEKLGSFNREYDDCTLLIKGPKSYQILEKNGDVHTVVAGIHKNISSKFKFGEIYTRSNEQLVYMFNKDNRYVLVKEGSLLI